MDVDNGSGSRSAPQHRDIKGKGKARAERPSALTYSSPPPREMQLPLQEQKDLELPLTPSSSGMSSRAPIPLPSADIRSVMHQLHPNGTVTTFQHPGDAEELDHTLPPGGQSPDRPQSSGRDMAGIMRPELMSPPTPAPSPSPGRTGWWGTVARDGMERPRRIGNEEGGGPSLGDPAQLLLSFPSLPPPTRLRLLEALLPQLSTPELLMLSANIGPRLKRDFLRDLPAELALHVLSFVEDATSLAKASLVSKHWYGLLQDEKTWKNMCYRHRFQAASVVPPIPSLPPVRHKRPVQNVPSARTSGQSQGYVLAPSQLDANTGQQSANVHGQSSHSQPQQSPGQGQSILPHDESQGAHQSYHIPASHTTPQNQHQFPAYQSHTAHPYQPLISTHPTSQSSSSAQHQGRINDHLPPMPSIVSPSALSSHNLNMSLYQATYGISGLGLNTLGSMPNIAMMPESNQHTFGSNSHIGINPQVEELARQAAGMATPRGLSQDGTGHGMSRSASVPEPVMMRNRRPSSQGKSPSDMEIDAPGFSYKNLFKRAYLTESNWLRGGRLLSTHSSVDEGTVTTLVMDDKYIAIGMATNKIHIFEAGRGMFLRTLSGHELGVWTLFLVSAGRPAPQSRQDDDHGSDYMEGYEEEDFQKSRKRARAETRRASFDEGSLRGQGQSRNGGDHSRQSQRPLNRMTRDVPLGSTDPEGPFGPRYPGCEHDGRRFKTGEAKAAYGWGQKSTYMVSGGCDRDIRVWDVETGECVHVLPGHTSTIRCLKVLDGRPVAVSGARDSTLRVWDIEKGVALHNLEGHQGSVRAVETAGHYCASGSYDCTARIWNLETGECLQVLRGHYSQVYDIAFDGERVVTGSLDNTVRVWAAGTGQCMALLQGHTSLVSRVQLRGDILVTGGSDGKVLVFNLATYTCLHRICAHDHSVTCLQFDDRFILTGGNDGRVKLWDMRTGNFIRELARPSETVTTVSFRNDKCAVLCKRKGKISLELLSFLPEGFS